MSATVEFVDAETARQWLEAGEAVLVDVREDAEYAQARIEGAQLVPLSRFNPAEVAVAPGQKVVVHCKSGVRCGPTSAALVGAGFAPVYRLTGGLIAWVEAGLPIDTGAA